MRLRYVTSTLDHVTCRSSSRDGHLRWLSKEICWRKVISEFLHLFSKYKHRSCTSRNIWWYDKVNYNVQAVVISFDDTDRLSMFTVSERVDMSNYWYSLAGNPALYPAYCSYNAGARVISHRLASLMLAPPSSAYGCPITRFACAEALS